MQSTFRIHPIATKMTEAKGLLAKIAGEAAEVAEERPLAPLLSPLSPVQIQRDFDPFPKIAEKTVGSAMTKAKGLLAKIAGLANWILKTRRF